MSVEIYPAVKTFLHATVAPYMSFPPMLGCGLMPIQCAEPADAELAFVGGVML